MNHGKEMAAAMKARYTILNDCFNSGNTAAIDTLLSPNSVDHTPDTSMHLPQGAAGLKQFIDMIRTGTPDLKSVISYMAVDSNILITYGTVSGTNTGPMMGMPATNKHWSADFADVIQFDASMKMTDHWGVFDQMKMMMDCGMMSNMSMPMDTTMTKKMMPPMKDKM
jgi:predicted ester cyclase